MDVFLHIGYLLSLISYSVRDMFLLRVILVSAYVFLLLAVVLPEGDPPINAYWFVLFIVANLVRIYLLYRERQPVPMSKEEQEIHATAFPRWKPRDFKRLMRFARWREAGPGQRLIRNGEQLDRLLLIYSGSVEVKKGSYKIGELRLGQFLGEMSFLTQTNASADVTSLEPVRYIEWTRHALERFLEKRPHLRTDIQTAIGYDLIRKLQIPDAAVPEEASTVVQ